MNIQISLIDSSSKDAIVNIVEKRLEFHVNELEKKAFQ